MTATMGWVCGKCATECKAVIGATGRVSVPEGWSWVFVDVGTVEARCPRCRQTVAGKSAFQRTREVSPGM